MMRLSYSLLSSPIEFEENLVNILIIENPVFFRKFIEDVKLLENNDTSELIFTKDYEYISFSKYIFPIYFALDLDFNNKKIITKIYQDLQKIAYDEFYLETTHTINNIEQFIQKLLENTDIPIDYSDMDLQTLFKSIKIKIDDNSTDFLTALCSYIKIISDIFGVNIIMFFNVKTLLYEDELISLYDYANYNKIQLLLCENISKKRLNYEKITIIDNDLCEI